MKDHDRVQGMTASTLTHETGHNLGLNHNIVGGEDYSWGDYSWEDYSWGETTTTEDSSAEAITEGCFCDADYCIMDAYAHQVVPVAFSACQQNQIRYFLENGT